MSFVRNLVLAGASLYAISTPAFAQETPDGASENNEIIVTARRKDERLQDVPLVVQAVTAQDLTKNQLRRLEDVSSIVPGLALTRANGTAAGTSTIRGVAFDSNASGSQTTIEFYRNDAVISSGLVFQSMFDIGQIEVLRGPQGTLRGRASPSGSFTITTRRPDLGEYGGYVTGTVANEDRYNLNGAINVPILRDRFAIRLAGALTRDRGIGIYGVNLFSGDVDTNIYDKSKAIRISARAKPFADDVLILDFNYEHIQRDQRYYEQVESRGLVEGNALNGPRTITSRDRLGIGAYSNIVEMPIDMFNWQAQLNLAGQSLTYVGGWSKQLNSTFIAGDVASVLPTPAFGFVSGGTISAATPWLNETYTTNIQESHEVRLQNKERIAGFFDYVVGYMNIKGSSPTLLYTGTASGSAAALTNLRFGGALRFRDAKEESFFGNLTAHIGERIEVSGGLRRISFKQTSGLTSAPGTTNRDPNVSTWPANAAFAVSDDKKETIYSVSAKFKVTDDIMVYGNYGTSWRPGNTVICTGCLVFPQAPSGRQLDFLRLADEKSNSFEVGIKSSWLDNRLKFNISAFWQKYDNFPLRFANIQALSSYSAGLPATGTIGTMNNLAATNAAKIRGVEAEMSFAASENFDLSANIAYAKGKISGGTFPCVDLNNDNIQDSLPISAANGNLQAYVDQVGAARIDTCKADAATSASPNWAGSVQAEYRHPISSRLNGYVRGLVTWRGSTLGDAVNPVDQVSSFALFNLYAGVRSQDGAWEITGYVKNLGNVHRVLTRNGSLVTTVISNAASSNNYYGGLTTTTPREVGLSARWSFGSR